MKEDLLARELAPQERGHVLDHRVHHGECGRRLWVDRQRPRFRPVGLARGKRSAGAIDRARARALDDDFSFRGELPEEPGQGNRRARAPAAVGQELANRRSA